MAHNTGEQQLIDIIGRTLGRPARARVGIGDDAAVLADGTILTTDAYVDGVHFDRRYLSLVDIGRRATLAAVSDVVAMAARPDAVVVALGLPAGFSARDIRTLYRGIGQACRPLGCEVVGGDIVCSQRFFLAISATGSARRPRLRSLARPGQGLYITDNVAAAETGRVALDRGLSRRQFGAAIARHRAPFPRLAAMLRLRPGIAALTDTSDGLATDARHLADSSRVRIVIDRAALPVLTATESLFTGDEPGLTRFLLTSGEDHELLFTSKGPVPRRAAGVNVTRIGTVEPGSGLHIRTRGRVSRLREHGYDHLAGQGKSC
ncbi:thiamine-phosphate kinase [candidate division WOR-3 bacterium]|nr:thiamine-phosphate kinase [candidate division WOR-3 bacterium]